jgi:hypothetical protein
MCINIPKIMCYKCHLHRKLESNVTSWIRILIHNSVITNPVPDPVRDPDFLSKLKKITKQIQEFIIFYDSLPIKQHVYFNIHKNITVGSGFDLAGSGNNWPP